MLSKYPVSTILLSFAVLLFANSTKEPIEGEEKLKCPPAPANCTRSDTIKYRSIGYKVNGIQFDVSIDGVEEVGLLCGSYKLAIDDPSIPRFDTLMFFQKVTIGECKPPDGSFAEVIDKLNLTYENLHITYYEFNNGIELEAKHFKKLESVKELTVETTYFLKDFFSMEPLLYVSGNTLLHLLGMTLEPFPSWNRFENVLINFGKPWKKSQTWGSCSQLRNLTLIDYKANTLPVGWLANCMQLKYLTMTGIQDLREIPQRMLENAISLESLTITNCKINVIPPDFLIYSKNLKFLDLSKNEVDFAITESSLFTESQRLEIIDLSTNLISAQDLKILKPLKSLKVLNLEENGWAGLCKDYILRETGENLTTWPVLPSLVNLSLSTTTVHKICPEWQESMPSLKHLNLSYSGDDYWNITFPDLEIIRESGWTLDLTRTDADIIYNETDYKTVLEDDEMKQMSTAALLVDKPLKCNCKWYWFIKTLKKRPDHVSVPELSCVQYWGDTTPKKLKDIDPEEVMCPLDKNCPPVCKCYQLAATNQSLVNCTNANLKEIPKIDNIKELVMPDNHISVLRIDVLNDNLDYIDLSNNLLSVVTLKEAKALFSVTKRKMKLSGNPILCNCTNTEFLELLLLRKNQVLDFKNLTCSDGTYLYSIDPHALCTSEALKITLILIGSIGIFIATVFGIYYFNRSKINSFLAKHGFKCGEEDSDTKKIYDAFISFSHEDTWFVINELMPVLEDETNGFKLCVHTRDWMPGDWIPAQIARSVQDSRRTVIILSKNFLSSIWALLEFRTAHMQALRDKRTRVVIILLEDLSSELQMDEELENYLATNTYLKWGENNFWKKLCKALQYKPDEKQIIEAGEKVAKLYKSDDPPIMLKAICDRNEDISSTEL